MSSQRVEQQWTRIRAIVRGEVGETAFNQWLKVLTLEGQNQNAVSLVAPNSTIEKWVKKNYLNRIQRIWYSLNPSIEQVLLSAAEEIERPKTPYMGYAGIAPNRIMQDEVKQFSTNLNKDFTFDSFVTGGTNSFAREVAWKFSDSWEKSLNQLFIYGGVGMGKTHLLHSIAQHTLLRNPNFHVVFLSVEKFMQHYVRAVREKDTTTFKDFYHSVDLLLLDDIHFIAGRDGTQRELLQIFNLLAEENKRIAVSADRPPAEIDGLSVALQSRLSGGLVTGIEQTDFDLRMLILRAKLEGKKYKFPDEILEFLAEKITSNVRELEGALNRLMVHCDISNSDATLVRAKELLHDLLKSNKRRITIDDIQKQVADHYAIQTSEMSSARRSRVVARPRQVAMYLAKQLTNRSLPEIGRKFGGRDHTTVMHATKKIEELMKTDSSLEKDVQLLWRLLNN
ncbi:MAG: chromosomal replication initiator protein DnaA [Alphaproteobacteria bacterium]|nr:chromosomal replication initiator protein DnaA [Alphaproteobacteria bacterium]